MISSEASFADRVFLIADDQSFIRSMIQSMLKACQVKEVIHAASGQEAMQTLAVREGKIDCVLCDWNMEPVNGIELLRAIRSGRIPQTPRDLRVLMLTGYAEEDVVKAALAMDANGYLIKPVSIDKLISAISIAFANPTRLKQPESYGAVTARPAPEEINPGSKRVTPWVLRESTKNRPNTTSQQASEPDAQSGTATPAETETKLVLVKKAWRKLNTIPPGKILAEDIYSKKGALLLSAGTTLSKTVLANLKNSYSEEEDTIELLVGEFPEDPGK